MSSKDLFTKYSKLYLKAKATEILPPGPFLRQLADVPHRDLDIALFFKSSRKKVPRQVYIRRSVPQELADYEGLLEAEGITYFSRTLLQNLRGMQYMRAVIGAGEFTKTADDTLAFLRKCQRVIHVLVRKAKNIVHQGDYDALRVDLKIRTLNDYFSSRLKLDEVAVEAAMIPFNAADVEYVILTDGTVLVLDEIPAVQHGVYHLVGGIGYAFDLRAGAVEEARLFRTGVDLETLGLTEAYLDEALSRVVSDFQTNVHSPMFSDVWKKGTGSPEALKIGNTVVKLAPNSSLKSGVFELYIRRPE